MIGDEMLHSAKREVTIQGLVTLNERTIKDKVLRRAEISRITRLLKNRLEIANFKASRGWQNLSFAAVEPKIANEVRSRCNIEANTTACISESHQSSITITAMASMEQDRPPVVGSTRIRKRSRSPGHTTRCPTCVSGRYTRSSLSASGYHRPSTTVSFSSLKSTSSLRTPSPPPPPLPAPIASHFKDSEEGADLLLYLATSPSPAKSRQSKTDAEVPSSPLQCSNQNQTPVGPAFNLSDFLNFTPSPRQLSLSRAHTNDSPTRRRLTYEFTEDICMESV